MSKSLQKGYLNILVILILVIGLLAGLYLVKQTTNIFPKAYDEKPIDTDPIAEPIIISNGRFGIAIDIFNPEKIPNTYHLQALSPGWVRFVIGPSGKVPSFPKYIKKLVIFNAESVPARPEDEDFSENWHFYIDKYIKDLENFIQQDGDNIDAVEIWNEEDICQPENNYCPGVPAVVYADILKKASTTIKKLNPNIKVIMGGLVTNDIYDSDGGYLGRVLKADPNIFDQVDALGLHPYGKTLNNWCVTKGDSCPEALPWGDIKESVEKYKAALPSNKKIWVTEIGQATYDLEWQQQYMKMVFDYLSSEAEVIIWYAWTDKMLAVEDVETDVLRMGLYDRQGNIKPAGKLFKKYSTSY